MSEQFSPKLRSVAHELADVMKKHDVAGLIVISEGLGMSEYKLVLESPTWSNVRFMKDGKAIHLKFHGKSNPVETQRTTNAIVGLRDVLGHNFMLLDKLYDLFKERIEVTNKGEMFHGPYPDDPKGAS